MVDLNVFQGTDLHRLGFFMEFSQKILKTGMIISMLKDRFTTKLTRANKLAKTYKNT